MTTDADRTLIFTDEAGADYALPEAAFRQWRVPDEQRDALLAALAGDDVAGYISSQPRTVTGFTFLGIAPAPLGQFPEAQVRPQTGNITTT